MNKSLTRNRAAGATLLVIGALLVAFAALLTSLRTTSAQLSDDFLFTLYGANEVPPHATDATGTVRLQLEDGEMNYQLVASGAQFTQAHIHYGPAGTNGPVIAFLLPLQSPAITSVNVSGTITVANLLGDFAGDWDAFATAFLSDLLYVNIHSVVHPDGELRGQADPRYCATLSGANEVPTNGSTGSGSVIINASIAGLGYGLSAAGGSQAYTAAHIHQGSTTENGMVMAFLFEAQGGTPVQSVSTTGQVLVGNLLGPAAGSMQAFLTFIAVSDAYVNVHSTTLPDGEIRGQLVHCDNVDAAQPPDPTATPTATTTATATSTATTSPTASATATNTTQPTATTVPATATATATPVPPGPPATGSGTRTGETVTIAIVLLGLAAVAAGGITLATTRRRS